MEKWDNMIAVQKMQTYMEEHLYEPVTLLDLAKCSNYSPFYAAKIFKELIGKSPIEYLRTLRLSQAALKLRDENVKVVDIAFKFSFDSHEGFTRAFTREFGITPNKYKKNPVPIELFTPYPVSDSYRMDQEGSDENAKSNLTIFVQVIDRPCRKLILKRGVNARNYMEYVKEAGDGVWGTLRSIKEALYEPSGMWLPRKYRPANTSHYAQGVEVPEDYNGIIPKGYDMIDLPACKLMVFQGQPYKDEDFLAVINVMRKAVDHYKPEQYGFTWAKEDAPHVQMEPIGMRGYIEAKPVKLLAGP